MPEFPGTSITKHSKLSGLRHRNESFCSCKGLKLEVRVLVVPFSLQSSFLYLKYVFYIMMDWTPTITP